MKAALPLHGHGAAEHRFLTARESGRLHHGWIIEGPSGIGKARLVQRLAALVLGAASPEAPADDPVMSKVLSGAHPDLKWIERELGDRDQLRQTITVDQIRSLNDFFSLKPALGGWRVGVVDALDETNLAGQNALLKTLEEPPDRSLLFLINHGATPTLATIRSRCQTLRLFPLGRPDTEAVLAAEGAGDTTLADLARGRPGYALGLRDSGGLDAYKAAGDLLDDLPRLSSERVSSGLLSASRDSGALAAFGDVLLDWVAQRALEQPAWSSVWFELHATRAEATALALTPLQTAAKLISILQTASKSLVSAE